MLVNVGRKRLDLVTNIGPVSKGGGGTPLCCRLYRYVPCHRVGFWSRFGLKTSIHFAHFGLKSGIVFEGTTGAYERIYRFSSKLGRKKERYANSKWIRRFFLLACEQALCLGKKNSEEREGKGGREPFSLFPLPSSPLDQRPVHGPFFFCALI